MSIKTEEELKLTCSLLKTHIDAMLEPSSQEEQDCLSSLERSLSKMLGELFLRFYLPETNWFLVDLEPPLVVLCAEQGLAESESIFPSIKDLYQRYTGDSDLFAVLGHQIQLGEVADTITRKPHATITFACPREDIAQFCRINKISLDKASLRVVHADLLSDVAFIQGLLAL